jgi:hypothetical protein
VKNYFGTYFMKDLFGHMAKQLASWKKPGLGLIAAIAAVPFAPGALADEAGESVVTAAPNTSSNENGGSKIAARCRLLCMTKTELPSSRLTAEISVYTHHFPDQGFNDHNPGLIMTYALNGRWSLAAGDIIKNSYSRNTAVAGVAYMPMTLLGARIGGMAGFDLNRGYRGHDPVDPLIAAVRMTREIFRDVGVAVIIIPPGRGGSTAMNVGVTYSFGGHATPRP